MTGRGDPPEGTPEGVPGGGEDEYRSVVFDESFVRAARLQEFSAQERMGEHARAVRSRHAWARAGASRQAVALVLLIAIAFAAAVYMGVRHPYQTPQPQTVEPLHSSVVPLAPRGEVPGGPPDRLFRSSPAAEFRTGAEGVTVPGARRTQSFSESQVMTALTTAKEYLVKSAIDPGVLTGGPVRAVRLLLDPAQQTQFDQSFAHPVDDGRHAATGWLTRFNPAEVTLADTPVRVRGTLTVVERSPATLEVAADHVFVYAVEQAHERGPDHASLFTVRREARFRFDRNDLRDHHLELVQSTVLAGPQACAANASGYLRPMLAGQTAKGDAPTGTDPYTTGRTTVSLCGVMAPGTQPALDGQS
ncbi:MULTISPECIES: SCO2583 family membrane protein [Streptomyces]|uniref:Uncharacterized protein n=1 Tax=Streptomyces melanosporofaciens TaxID=67327 RepID=A0A1H4N2M3_STRMJ|nr:hypothetical protein [Streptomyces melanosporofaciens]SEB89529.1 hypothetical protein SAMN04490356_2093 [Streptomyces melanosporofaciens]